MKLLSMAFFQLCLTWCLPIFSQLTVNTCVEIDLVINELTKNHYDPIEITDEVKSEIIHLYVNEIDASNRFIDTEKLQFLETIAINESLCAAFAKSKEYFFEGVKSYDSLMHLFTKTPVKLNKGEIYKDNYASTKHLRASGKDFNANLIRMFKFDYLSLAYDYAESDSIHFTSEKQLTYDLDTKWRNELLSIEKMYLQRITENKEETESLLFEQFLNSITMRFDPHTNYFSMQEMEQFEEGLSRETKSFGVQLVENDDYEIEVSMIIPGSSAWFSGEFTEGDIVESVITSSGETYVFTLKGMDYVRKILKNPNTSELTFSVRKKSGERTKINLTKTEVENIDNAFRGYLMEKDNLKLGYISLPSFYTDFESDAMLGCANDVAKEIIFLKKEGINGLVLDLRNNGGGSIKEAVELCGLFIPEGPICILDVKGEKLYLLKDMNRGTVYDGPLMILVNNSSASASEVVAGCLQDYKRALIVGDVTFGKGTAQSIYDVMDSLSAPESLPSGQMKITDGKFYHISKRSNQSVGIVPDIRVGDIFSSIDFFKEKYEPFHLENDSTAKNVVYKVFTPGFTTESILKSQDRIDQKAYFKNLKLYSDSLKNLIESDQLIPIDFVAFMNYKKNRSEFMKRFYEVAEGENEEVTILNHAFVKRMMSLNELEKKMNDDTIESIESDVIIQESMLIFKEVYNLESNKQ